MAKMTKLGRDRMGAYFESFTKRFLQDDSPEAVDVEVLAPDWGDQYAARGAQLYGVTYDHGSDALEFAVESGTHRIYHPGEVWIIEESDGFIGTIEVERPDRTREIITVKRVGIQTSDQP